MEESWQDLLRRVYYAGYDDRQRERDYDPMDHKIVDSARIKAEQMEQRICELEAVTADLLNQLQGIGIYAPGEDEGQWVGTEGLSFSRIEKLLEPPR